MTRTATEGRLRIGTATGTDVRGDRGSSRAARRSLVLDLFAGAGGLSLGFEQAGFDIAAAVELDPIHLATHKLNFPYSLAICADVRDLDGDGILDTLGVDEIDAVIGGPPCQGFSLIGHRVLGDPRNELVFHFLRLVKEIRPRVFVMENVPGMATGAHTELLDELVAGFRAAGYEVRLPYRLLNAANYGIPQNRRRLVLLGARSDTPLPAYPDATTRLRANGGKGEREESGLVDLPYCPSVRDAIADLPDIEDYPELLESDELRVALCGGSPYARTLRGEREDPADFGWSRERDGRLLTGCLRARHTELSRRRFAETPPGATEPVSRFYRLALEGACNTLRAGTASDRGAFSAPRPIHPVYPRCISIREAARLHSYPDWFRFHRTIWHGFRQIGNSVPPLLARAIGQSVMTALGASPKRPRAAVALGSDELASFDMRKAAAFFGVDPGVVPPRRRVAVAN